MKKNLDNIQTRLLERDELSPVENRRLNLALCVQPELKRQITKDEQIDGLLRSLGRCEDAGDMFVESVVSAIAGKSNFPELTEHRVAAAKQRTTASRRCSHRVLFAFSGIAAAALIATALLIAFVGKSGDNPVNREKTPLRGVAERSGENEDTPKPAPKIAPQLNPHPDAVKHQNPDNSDSIPIAKLVAEERCRWKDGKTPSPNITRGSLELLAGTAKVEFQNGAIVELTGPTTFEVQSRSSGFLHAGRVFATVPKRAVGFTVETPVSTVVDLGTEFQVTVEPNGTVEVKVHKGKVDYREHDSNGGVGKRWRLSAGESHREQPVAPGRRTTSADVRPSRGNSARRVYRGVTIINGKRYTFRTREEYEQLQRERKRLRKQKP